ncbi:MAG: uridine kinase [Bdellovibrionaceae bacterium]|nr:uridine kinase [Pseudobdellovibrionaceae bacterium]
MTNAKTKPIIIAISGGSGSGKTTLSREIRNFLSPQNCGVLYQDSYYIDQSNQFDKDGGRVNFDHPSAIDFKLLETHVSDLKKGKPISIPFYNFSTHTRSDKIQLFEPKPYIIVDGILILNSNPLKELFDFIVFIKTSEDVRFERRLKRDVEERGRTPQGVKAQFENQVKPMHDEYVEPHASSAHLIVSGEHSLSENLEILKNHDFFK